MQAARKAPKRSAAVFNDDGNSPTAKRQRFASSPSQDSDENGQTPLGITFGDPVPAITQDKDVEIEIADSQEDVENEETPVKKVKKAKKASSKKKSVQDINGIEKDSPERASVSSINIDDIPVMTSPKDVQIRLGAKQFMFSPRECKAIVRWMRMHRTYKISSHKTEFNELMHHLGYTSALLSQKDQNELRTKLRTKMAALHTNMKKTGAITDDYDGYDSSGSGVFRPLPFEEWTLMWYKKGWDGSLHKPDQKTYEKVMNERDDDAASSKRAVKERNHGEAEKDGDQANDEDNMSGEEQTEVPNALYEGEFDGTELFVVEEPYEIAENRDHAPPEDDEPAESNGWNTYILNKEIIDEHDWNYRVVTAQHLGIDLKDLAILYPDPFPGYEPPPGESSAPPTTPIQSDASTAPSAPCTPSPAPTKSSGRPDSDESISLEVTDAEDDDEDRVPGTRAIDYADDSEEDMGDDEMEEDDIVDDVGADVVHQSQTSTTNVGHRTNDTQVSTPSTPMTPQRSISRQSRTPRSATPTMYSAIWSPRD